MTPTELQHAGYYCTSVPWNVQCTFVRKGSQGRDVRVVGTIFYNDNEGSTLDERMAKAWDLARVDYVRRRLNGEVV